MTLQYHEKLWRFEHFLPLLAILLDILNKYVQNCLCVVLNLLLFFYYFFPLHAQFVLIVLLAHNQWEFINTEALLAGFQVEGCSSNTEGFQNDL